MSTSPPPAPRRSGRERKQAEIFSSQPDANRKRKRGSEPPSEDEDEVDHDEERRDEDEEMEDQQQEESEEEEHEEDYVAPRKAVARKAKASTSGANGQASEIKKPRAPRVPKVPKPTVKPRRRKGKGDGDADPKAIAKESAIADDNGLFNAIMNPAAALQSTAEDFLDSYNRTAPPALADLINCILRCCGCNASIDSDQVLDTDGVVDCLEDLMEAMKKEPVLAYPLASKLPVFKKFRKSLSEFLNRLIVSAAETGALYDEQLVAILQTWVMAMSSANLRSFRHTATVVALEVESALAEVAAVVDKEAEVLRRQREGEKKKASNKGKGREQDLQTKFDDVQNRKKHLKELMKEIFDAVFVLRYRDADPGIRAECVQEFGVWVEKYPAFFLEGNHLRYIGWVLSDTNTQVRLAAVKSLYSLYKRDELLVSTNHFTQRYKPRLVAMAASDIEISVRVAVIQVLCAIDALGELDEDQSEQMELLVFDQEPRVRKAISSFVHGVWKNAVDERLGTRRQGGDAGRDKVRVGFKCLGSLLVKWAKKLEKDEEGDVVPDQTESQEGASDSGGGGQKSKEVTALVSDLQRGRIALCVDSLWDEVDAVSDWEELMEFLLLDHSAEGEDDVSPVASKRKRAAEANAKKGKGRRKSAVNDSEVDEAWRLEDSEEAALVEVLVASLKKTIADAGEKKKGEADAAQADVTRALIKSLPQLFAKNQADERRISEVILIPQVMNLDLYAEMGLNKPYETLWDEVTKHFLSHSSPIVIRNAAITISRLLTTSAMFRENEAKIAQLEEEMSTSLRDVVAGRDDLDAAFLEDDEVHALSGFALRVESLFRVRDLSGWMENDEDGRQSSVWNIILSLASRGSQGHKGEESLLDHAFQVLTFHVAWKVKHLPTGDPNAEGASEAREALQKQRDMLVETLDSAAFGPNSRAGDEVRRSAVKCLLILYTLFLPKQSDGEGHPYPAASIPLEVSEEMQFRFEGFIEAEVERYADDLADEEEEQERGDGDKASEPADSDEGEGGENQAKKPKKVAKKTIDPDAVSQSRLEKEYVFTSTIASFLSAMRAGIIQISHASKVLAYYGRLGMTYDQCMKVVIELLREEGMYRSRGFIVAEVIKDAVRDSFLLYLEGRAPDDEHTLALVKAMSAALVIRGAQLSIVQRLDGENVVTIHQELVAWVTKRIAQYEKSGNKKLRNAAIEFFHSLTQLLVSADSADASQIQEHLKKSLDTSNIEPSATARFWEPLRSYEKRLSTIATKDKEKAPAKGRRKSKKHSAKSGDEATTDEEMGLDDVRDDEPPASPPPRPSPQRKTRSRKSLAKEAATEEPPERPKARPRPRTRARGQREPEPDADEEAPAEEPSEPSQQTNGNLNSPQLSPEPAQSLPNGHSQSPERGTGKRKRDLEDFEDPQMDDDADDEEPEQPAASPPARKHHSRPSSQISQISQMDVDFFKTRKRFRR